MCSGRYSNTKTGGDRVRSKSFLGTLSETERAVVKAKLFYPQERGSQLREPLTKSMGDGLYELRVHAYRIFFCFRPGNRIVLLHAFRKKSQATPRRELDLARKRISEV
ncbi:MAG: type II toxin-antitoxin system RelE/ParE family toxin [Candidatus Binatia bacterium]